MLQMALMLGIVIIAVLLLLFDYSKGYIRQHFANDANKGRVYILCGDDIAIVKAKRIYVASDGDLYGYSWGGMDLAVIVPPDYGYQFIEGRRCLAVVDGQTLAAPFSIGEVQSEGVCDVSAIVIGEVVVELVKSLTGQGQSKWLWLIIGGVVVVALYFGYQMMFAGEASPVVPGEYINPDLIP